MNKLLNISIALMVSFTLLFASCNDTESIVEIKLDNNRIELKQNEQVTITVLSGNGGYEAKSSDAKVSVAIVYGTSIVIKAVDEGTSTITVTDRHGKSASINVTVSFAIPSSAWFSWNGTDIELDKAGGYGITILSSGIGLTDLFSDEKQYFLSWSGGLTEGTKNNGVLVISEASKAVPETVTLTSVRVVQSGTRGNYILFGNTTANGELFFHD